VHPQRAPLGDYPLQGQRSFTLLKHRTEFVYRQQQRALTLPRLTRVEQLVQLAPELTPVGAQVGNQPIHSEALKAHPALVINHPVAAAPTCYQKSHKLSFA
jgi:hypothetical protein